MRINIIREAESLGDWEMTPRIIRQVENNLIEFLAKDGCQLHGSLVSKKNKKAVIFIPGMGGNFYRSIGLRMYKKFINGGFDLFLLNTRGHDTIAKVIFEKTRNKNRRVKFLGTGLEKFEESFYDIKAAVDLLDKLRYKKTVLMGHSSGCHKAIYYQYKANDKRILALVLLAPSDDYNLEIKRLGNKWVNIVKKTKKLIKKKKGDTIILPEEYFSAQRFDSISNLNRVESRLFNYDKNLKEFSMIRKPILVIFGSKDKGLTKSAAEHLKILKSRTSSKKFDGLIVKNADHGFKDYEDKIANKIISWLRRIK